MIKALIIDDEERARKVLRALVQKHIPEIKQLKEAAGAEEGIAIMKTFQPDLLFLDIEMPFKNGFETLETIDRGNFDVIFTTAHDQYAIKAIRFSALDYLLKPIDSDELKTAIKKHLDQQLVEDQQIARYKNLIDNLKETDQHHFKLAVATVDNLFFIPSADIIFCKADRNYTLIHLKDGKSHLSSKTLKEYEEILSDHNFIRVHKSHLINLRYVKSYSYKGTLDMIDGTSIIVARRRKQQLLEALK